VLRSLLETSILLLLTRYIDAECREVPLKPAAPFAFCPLELLLLKGAAKEKKK